MRTMPLVCCAIMAFSCTESAPTSPGIIQAGIYDGRFSITYHVGTDSAFTVGGNCTFVFGDTGWYSCRGEIPYHPPAGGGRYRFTGDSLFLTDRVPHTAEFDWTLILNGSFKYKLEGGSLTMTQNDTRFRRYRSLVLDLRSS
jgi:hypothetical protein